MKTFTKHILLLALMLFGVAGAAWASRAPQKFTGPVAKTDLVEGDTLAPGFSITGLSVSNNLIINGNRYRQGGVLGNGDMVTNGSTVTGYGGDNPVAIIISETILYTPVDESGQDGNAWVVTYNSSSYLMISGISITPDPTVPALDELTGNWNFLMPGSNKVVKAVLLDSIVVGPHVSVSFSDLAIEGKYANGTDTVYYYDTNSHPSITLMAANNDGQGRNFGYWADLDPTDPEYSSWYRYLSSGSFTCGDTFRAVYPENHTLTLVTPQGGGTLEIASVGVETVYNITFEQSGISGDNRSFTIPASRFPYDTTFSYNANIVNADAYDQMHESVSMIPQSSNTVTVRISGPFQYGGYYSCELEGGASDDWSISCMATGTQPKMPYGITKTSNGTYSVMEGLTVNVTALSAIGNEAVISNSAYNISFTMPDDDAELAATFTTKPTLTLAQTAGGTLEALVPQGGATAMHLTTDQISTWDEVYEPVTEADLQPFGFVAVDSAAAAAWTGAPASGEIFLLYAPVGGDSFKAILFRNGQWVVANTIDFNKADIYEHSDLIYFTTGASKGNVIASSTPNTYYIDYGTPVTVVATPDSAHYLVSFSDDAPATERNSNIAVEKTYDSVIAPKTLSANFQAKPVLTLTANDGGTLTLDGVGGTTLTLISYSNIDLPDYQTVSREEARALCGTDITSGTAYVFYKNEGTAYIGIQFQNGVEQELDIAVSNISYYVPDPYDEGLKLYYTTRHSLDGVTATETENQYRVDYGTDVTVVATPAEHYHLQGWSSNVTDNGDSTATLTMTQNETVSATFAQNAPELAWEYAMTTDDTVLLANGTEISAYDGFAMDTIAKILFSANKEFLKDWRDSMMVSKFILRFGSSNTNVVSFANPFDPQSLSVNAPGTATVYMVHDGSVMAYDSAYFTAVILAPDTLTLVHNDGGEMTVELGSATVWNSETWAGWPNQAGIEKTIGDISLLGGESTYLFDNNGNLGIGVMGGVIPGSSPLTISTTGNNFTRIEMTMTEPASTGDRPKPNITPADGWTVTPGSTLAVWEGNANTITFSSCTTSVSQMVFYRSGANSADSIRAIVADTTYAVVPGANVTVKATPDSAHYLVNWDNDAAIYSNTDTTKHYVVNGNVTSTATFNAKPVLTLAANDTTWGKVTLGGYSPAGPGTEQLSVPSGWNDDWDNVLATEMPLCRRYLR